MFGTPDLSLTWSLGLLWGFPVEVGAGGQDLILDNLSLIHTVSDSSPQNTPTLKGVCMHRSLWPFASFHYVEAFSWHIHYTYENMNNFIIQSNLSYLSAQLSFNHYVILIPSMCTVHDLLTILSWGHRYKAWIAAQIMRDLILHHRGDGVAFQLVTEAFVYN